MTASNRSLAIDLSDSEVRAMRDHLATSRISEYKIDHAAVGFFKLFQALDEALSNDDYRKE